MARPEVLIVAVGNDLLGDDAVGIEAGLVLKAEGFPVEITIRSGLALLDLVEGVRKVLLIDSQTTGGVPGDVSEFTLGPSVIHSPSPHYLGYGEALAIGRVLGLDLPGEIRVLAVERADAINIGAGLSDAVRRALPKVIHRARDIIGTWSGREIAV
ncbi:MAG: hydrogenase maturation protease [Armatimonadota bacterium]|nr:hydrogenase maturation protease [Armatimonadota bacterium]